MSVICLFSRQTYRISTLISHSTLPQVNLAAFTRQILHRSVERTIYVLRDVRVQKPVWDEDYYLAKICVEYDFEDRALWTRARL